MKRYVSFSLFLVAGLAFGQDADRVTVPFSDAARPKMVSVHLINGGIDVKGYAGKDVIVEARSRGGERNTHVPERAKGMHRIGASGTGLSVEEADNVVEIKTTSWSSGSDVSVQVPFSTSLKLKTMNDGDIVVDHVSGDIEVDDLNGKVTLTSVSGSALVHALNGKILAAFDRVTPGKVMSFSSLNGDIDVTFPADLRAKVRVKTDNGEAYSDFDIRLDPNARKPEVEHAGGNDGKYRVKFERGTWGTINGGGPEMQFTTLNGNIFIRKGK
ncbi:MAG TPA: DUF4097 family beta strand repeat-containing protein [Bryobacteraceae bacterium]|jgi:DUF4097 and DUF4098 domain-containing protein YvlB|nr:DUF4097 family beta strand repeat-containing protein [Bryobacteraceae bacterium]